MMYLPGRENNYSQLCKYQECGGKEGGLCAHLRVDVIFASAI